jgi:hypothetical protein
LGGSQRPDDQTISWVGALIGVYQGIDQTIPRKAIKAMTQTPSRRGTTNIRIDDDNMKPAELIRLGRLGRSIRLTGQILSIDMDTVSIVEGGPAPAWTTLEGDHISFAMDKMPMPNSVDDLAVWLGTFAHELGHVMRSPRRHTPLMQSVMAADKGGMPGLFQLHNILEDQRQERLTLGRFAPWHAFLVAALGYHLQVTDESAWLLLCGRSWLPATIRDQAKARFVVAFNQTVADEVAVIVGSYQRLIDPGVTEFNDAYDLLIRLHNLLPHMPTLPSCCVVMRDGDPDTDSIDDEDMPPAADEATDEDEDEETTGNDQGSGEDTPDASEDEGGGIGHGGVPPMSTKDIRAALQEAAKQQLEDDEESKREIANIFDVLINGGLAGDVDGEPPEGRFIEVTDRARSLRHEVGDALLDLKDQSEPGWLKRTDSGRFMVRSFINPNLGPDEWFDRYNPGEMDASEMEVVVLLDVSGSMMGQTFALSEATWAIRHAVDDLEGSCTVFSFCSGDHRVLARPNDRPDDRMFLLADWGGTEPQSALEEAHRILADSNARNRLMVVMTDGGWWNSGKNRSSDNMIAAMNQAGITTVAALLGSGVNVATDRHGCTYAASIDEPLELARLFRRVAEAQIGQWL